MPSALRCSAITNHAAYITEDETALTPDAVNKMLAQLAPPAVANTRKEAADIQALIDQQAKAAGTKSFTLAPWDWDFYAEQVRAAKFSYDESQVRPYFEMNRVLVDGVLFAAQELYGITFKERTICRCISRTCACSNCGMPMVRRWDCSWSTGTRATTSAAAPG